MLARYEKPFQINHGFEKDSKTFSMKKRPEAVRISAKVCKNSNFRIRGRLIKKPPEGGGLSKLLQRFFKRCWQRRAERHAFPWRRMRKGGAVCVQHETRHAH